ncbi:MAG: hypothetical protein U0Z44_04205 [Kouleothrix sp.]
MFAWPAGWPTLIATGRQQYEVEAAEALERAQRDLDQLAELSTYAGSNSTPLTLNDLFQRDRRCWRSYRPTSAMIQSARGVNHPSEYSQLARSVLPTRAAGGTAT